MTYALLKFAHMLGAILIGAGLISVWLTDLRSRQSRVQSPLTAKATCSQLPVTLAMGNANGFIDEILTLRRLRGN
jgi:hypothetical protein